MIAAVAGYFAFVIAAFALWLLPQARARAAARARRLALCGAAARRRAAAHATHGARGAARCARAAGAAPAGAAGWLGAHRREALAVGAAFVAAPLVPFALHPLAGRAGADRPGRRPVNEQVAELLRGEQLVPPPAAPPELYATPEVEQARPAVRGASRQWELLDADFRQRLLVVFRLMRERHGYEMVLLEGYRSAERQARLAALGPQVTRAGAYESWHQHGLAADCAFLQRGRIVVSERDAWAAAGYALYGEAARSLGLVWGGGWQGLRDYGHVELRRAGVMRRPAEAA